MFECCDCTRPGVRKLTNSDLPVIDEEFERQARAQEAAEAAARLQLAQQEAAAAKISEEAAAAEVYFSNAGVSAQERLEFAWACAHALDVSRTLSMLQWVLLHVLAAEGSSAGC